MKKLFVSLLFWFVTGNSLFAGSPVRLLRILDEPVQKSGKSSLLFNLADIRYILTDPEISQVDQLMQIRLYSPEGKKITKLGTIHQGKIDWFFTPVENQYLPVHLESPFFEKILYDIRRKSGTEKYLLALTIPRENSKSLAVVKTFSLAFSGKAELSGLIIYPLYVRPGEDLDSRITVEIFNEGVVPARDFNIELRLSADQAIPFEPGKMDTSFTEDMLLCNGRRKIAVVEPGRSATVAFQGPMTLPADIAEGKYYLAVVIDPDKLINEDNRADNVMTRILLVSKGPTPKKSDSERVVEISGF